MKIDRQVFTLIELLIVVAIIGILAAIAVPNFLNTQTRAAIARVQGDFNAITTAFVAGPNDETKSYRVLTSHKDFYFYDDMHLFSVCI